MARLRRDTQDSGGATTQRPLRVVASGTLFVTNNLGLPTHPEANSVIRAHSVSRDRGGSASTCLSIIAQFPAVEAVLIAPLGGNEEGRRIISELEKDRVSTRYCKVWPEAGVPSAWVLHADDTDSRTVINNNPLPDITHEEFISLTGPLLVPENYVYQGSPLPSTPPAGTQQTPGVGGPGQPRPSTSNSSATPPVGRPIVNSPAPIDWMHFEGRSVKTTLSNIMGLDGLARERKWRSHCVFSIDVGRRARQGVEALIPHADVLFLNKHYARAHSPQYASSPRAFLLSFTNIAPPHALLVAHWGSDGAAVLSVPTREYFQSSGWVEPNIPAIPSPAPAPDPVSMRNPTRRMDEPDLQSVRTGSDFWAGGHSSESSSMFTADLLGFSSGSSSSPARRMRSNEDMSRRQKPNQFAAQHQAQKQYGRTNNGNAKANGKRPAFRGRDDDEDEDSSDSDGTQIAGQGGGLRPVLEAPRPRPPSEIVDEVGAQEAFVAGMMWALSRRLLPGEPYTPSAAAGAAAGAEPETQRGRWRLEECLRFATELAGRKGRRKGWSGLADEMASAGWFDS